MKKFSSLFLFLLLSLFAACNVHEWPEPSATVQLCLRLRYDLDMSEWHHLYSDTEVIEQGIGKNYPNQVHQGKMRYIVRAYPRMANNRNMLYHTHEFVIFKDVADGYNHELNLNLPPGDYTFRVWSDLVSPSLSAGFYNADNFAEVTLQGNHVGNTDYRDAFRGSVDFLLNQAFTERKPDTLEVAMQRPLAKFEFITNDLTDFIDKESIRIAAKAQAENARSQEEGVPPHTDDVPTRNVNIEDYKVMFYYVGFMPNAFSLFTDKPIDSATGVAFEATLKKLNATQASMGFDYVFVNGKESAVTLQVAVYDNEGTQLSLTKPISVPLKRSRHTMLVGTFLMSQAEGGVTINPDYEGDHNVIIP